jgi:hypothetical protein
MAPNPTTVDRCSHGVLYDRLILYGISEKTLERLDRLMDGRIDFTRGRVSGSAAKNREMFIGRWQL